MDLLWKRDNADGQSVQPQPNVDVCIVGLLCRMKSRQELSAAFGHLAYIERTLPNVCAPV